MRLDGEKWKYDSSWKTSKWDAYAGNSLNLQLVSLIIKGSLFPLVTLTSLTFFSWAPPPPSFFFFLCIFCYRPMFQCFMLFKPNISFYTVRNFLSPIFPSIPSSILPFISPHSPPPPVCPPASQRNGQGLSSISGMHRLIPQITRVHTAVADITGGKGSVAICDTTIAPVAPQNNTTTEQNHITSTTEQHHNRSTTER